MTRSLLRAVVLTWALALLTTPSTAQSTATTDAAGAIETLDCYQLSDPSYLQDQGAYTFQSSGYCKGVCVALNKPVMATTGGTNCFCGDELPPASAKTNIDNCNTPCKGFSQQTCGGIGGYFQLYLSGLTGNVQIAPNSSSSTAAANTASKTTAAVVTMTVSPTSALPASASTSAAKSGKSSGTSKVGIAVGVVVGVIALAGIIGAVVFVMKRKRNREIEEEHRRNAAIGSAKSDKSSVTDQRLDPSIYSHRRQSIGSIADERDFSRRILQVQDTQSLVHASFLMCCFRYGILTETREHPTLHNGGIIRERLFGPS
ncbi:hypothetical protein PV08_10823 [Exophiala spinifera]|uniref:WSC domain-containing protein n=1 Tax=Exophiala spinifera TaxID=91928 RepID=A0A0D1ZF00_9EURO|nr:uncharacterized protein PV08_10823 [Exophiala spinifera]KIW11522.1 hypothetical protein PV08_10823 [Exophiala spinifera]